MPSPAKAGLHHSTTTQQEEKSMTHEERVEALIARITKLGKSLPESMHEAMQRRICAQASVAVAKDALLIIAQEEAQQ
jgi:hypothetical protein